MLTNPVDKAGPVLIVLWLLALGLCLWMSGPLFAAWTHDPSLRQGEYVFTLWLFAAVVHWSWPEAVWPWRRTIFLVAAGVMLFLGILGELQALIYFALACLLCLPVRPFIPRVLLAVSSVLWMPVWAWSMGPHLGASIEGVSLGLALCLACFSLLARCFIYGPKANTPAL